MKYLLFLLLLIPIITGHEARQEKPYRFRVVIDGLSVETDSVWQDKRNIFFKGKDGIHYGITKRKNRRSSKKGWLNNTAASVEIVRVF